MTDAPSLYDDYLAALLRGDRSTCARIVRELLLNEMSIRTIYTDWFCAALYHVGELWESNRISVATEHLATAITERVMSEVVAPVLFGREPVGRSLMIACVPHEFHRIGGRMVADLAEMRGWDTYFLGANTPPGGLLALLDEKQPDVLALSLGLPGNLPDVRNTIGAVRALRPEMPIWLGGQAFRWGGREVIEEASNLQLFDSLEVFEAELDRLAANYS